MCVLVQTYTALTINPNTIMHFSEYSLYSQVYPILTPSCINLLWCQICQHLDFKPALQLPYSIFHLSDSVQKTIYNYKWSNWFFLILYKKKQLGNTYMTVLIPDSCWNICRPQPTIKALRVGGYVSILQITGPA